MGARWGGLRIPCLLSDWLTYLRDKPQTVCVTVTTANLIYVALIDFTCSSSLLSGVVGASHALALTCLRNAHLSTNLKPFSVTQRQLF